MSRCTSLFLLLTLLGLCPGCSQCTSTSTSISQVDGGALRCVTAEDCPRTGNELVCVLTSPVDYASSCVGCVSTECVRVTVVCP